MSLFENLQIMNENQTTLNSTESTKKFMSDNLKLINDQAFANVLREILFQSDLNWQDIQLIISRHMPEVKIEKVNNTVKTEDKN